jgi:hypothetical protein
MEVRDMPVRGPTIADTVLGLIREGGPMTLDELVPPIVASGRTRAKNPHNAVRAAIASNAALVESPDGRWHSLADQLDGAVFSVRLTSLERREQIVLVRDDLALVERLVPHAHRVSSEDAVHLDYLGDYLDIPFMDDVDVGGIRAELDEETAAILLAFLDELGVPPGDDEARLRDLLWETRFTQVLHGPRGWIPTLGTRQLLGITITGGAIGAVALDRRSLTGLHVDAAGNRLARLAQRVIGPDPSWFGPPVITLEELLELVATEAPELFRRPLPPFTEVVRRGGLEVEDGLVGRAGTDWDEVRWAESPDPEDAWGFEPPDVVH